MRLTRTRKLTLKEKLYAAVLAAIFFLMLGCNCLTKYLADDFSYMFSFADGKRIEGILDIFPSMLGHAEKMNGRLIAHSLVQLSMLVPAWVFDIVNALMCLWLVWEIEGLCRDNGKREPLVAGAAFCGIWYFLPAFGQAALWQDGAINYLWSVCFAVPLLGRIAWVCLYDKQIGARGSKFLVLILSFVAGGYSESTSLAVVVCMGLLLLLRKFYLKKKVHGWLIASFALAAAGYISIYLAPAQWANKSAALSFNALFNNLVYAVDMYKRFGGLAVVFVVLIILCVYEKADMAQILLAAVLVVGSLAANFIHVVAAYYSDRSAVAAVLLLLAADVVLLRLALTSLRLRAGAVSLMAVMLLVSVPSFVWGIRDIAVTYSQVSGNEAWIQECREQGIMDVEISNVYTFSKYSPLYQMKYIDTETTDTWPNSAMSRYYGVDSIIGK